MITFQSYRSNMLCLLVITFALAFSQNMFCAYAGIDQKRAEQGVNIAEPEPAERDAVAPHVQNAPRPNPISSYLQSPQSDPTKKNCCAFLGLITFITIIALKSNHMLHDEPAPSIWQEDGCLPGCRSAFNASGALVNTTQRSYGSWGPLIIGCNGDTSAYSRWCLARLHFCMQPISACTYPNPRYPMPIGLREEWCWNPANVTKEKMIAEVSSFCKTADHIAFCHCENDPEEGSCTIDPLRIADILPKDGSCKKPEPSNQKANNFEKMSLRDRLKERLKTLRDKRMNNSSHVLRTKKNPRNQSINQPRQRSKR